MQVSMLQNLNYIWSVVKHRNHFPQTSLQLPSELVINFSDFLRHFAWRDQEYSWHETSRPIHVILSTPSNKEISDIFMFFFWL